MFVTNMHPREIGDVAVFIFWTSSTVLVICQPFVSHVKSALAYGKHQDPEQTPKSGDHAKGLRAQNISTFLGWTTYYFIGVFTSALCIYLSPPPVYFPLYLCLMQTLRRVLECLFVHRFSKTRGMSLFHLLTGVSYYTAVPVTLYLQSETGEPVSSLLSPTMVTLFRVFFIRNTQHAQYIRFV